MSKKAVLIGTGGVGTIVALALEYSKKCEVTMVARSVYEKASKDGFDIESCDYGSIKGWKPHAIENSIENAAKSGPYDYVVVTTKNIPEVQKIEDIIAPLVVKGNSIVLIQNGIGAEEKLMKVFPDSYIIGGISMIGSAIYGNEVCHQVTDEVLFGTYDKRPEALSALDALYDIYSGSKSKAQKIENLRYRRWIKLVYNSAYNTVAAVTGLDVGRLLLSDITYNMVLPAMKEVRAIAEAELKQKLPEDIENFMIHCDGGVYFEPSMLVDIKKGQPMELEVILGNPLRIAAEQKIDAPVLKMLYTLLHGKQFTALEKRGNFKFPEEPFDSVNTKPLFPLDL